MPSLAAQITAAGISAPDYDDTLAQLKNGAMGIYGSDIVIKPDTQDGQYLAIFAQGISDSNQTLIATYNSFSPANAQGAALSSLIKINGLKRETPSNSQIIVTIGGQVDHRRQSKSQHDLDASGIGHDPDRRHHRCHRNLHGLGRNHSREQFAHGNPDTDAWVADRDQWREHGFARQSSGDGFRSASAANSIDGQSIPDGASGHRRITGGAFRRGSPDRL
jgi:hypothetical protein